ncbi:hypothetical protein [Aliiroseovarius sp. 2305UL8-7]|uniref:hypothetical protein n=1 Tax=Aliiroseovarius conchicola TaxID=3121637 RepID=UPI003528AA21
MTGELQQHRYESGEERNCFYVNAADPQVVDIIGQPICVTYRTAADKMKQHNFDMLCIRNDGMRVLYAVKPRDEAIRSGLVHDLPYIAKAVPRDVADRVKLFTDRSYPRWYCADARRLFEINREPDEEADAVVGEISAGLEGQTTLGDVTALAGMKGRGFRAAFRAVFAGKLRRLQKAGLSGSSIVTRGQAA